MKKEADKLFADEQYVAATSTYLSLLSLYPSSSEYNYKYGACLLYNSAKKQTAIKFLATAITDPAVDPIAYFFLGKAFHLNFQFNSAITNYQIFLTKSSDELRKKEVRRQLEMCENGKNLLRQLSDLVVLEKKETNPQNFFRSYNLENIGGSIVVAADFQSKIDVKRKHFPLVYFPANSDTVYYSSFGDVDKGNKDIYFKTRTLEGTWSSAQTVKGMVNTNEDEDFPFLAADRHTLYFSSKGHNSMGGYDVFRSERVAEKHAFSTPINCDFAISSPDDDLFYITDSLGKYAYFASSRQSENGKLVVYKVRVTRVPSQLLVGDFTFEDEQQAAQLKATSELQPNAEKYSDSQFTFASKWSDIARDLGAPNASPVEIKQKITALISDKQTFSQSIATTLQVLAAQLTEVIEEAQEHAESAAKSYELAQTTTSDSLRQVALEEVVFQLDFQQELITTINQLKALDVQLTQLQKIENTAINALKQAVINVEKAENDQTSELLVQSLEELQKVTKKLDKTPTISLEAYFNDQKVELSLQKQVIEKTLATDRAALLTLNDNLRILDENYKQAKPKEQAVLLYSITASKDELAVITKKVQQNEERVKLLNDSLQRISESISVSKTTTTPDKTFDTLALQKALELLNSPAFKKSAQLLSDSEAQLDMVKKKNENNTLVAVDESNNTKQPVENPANPSQETQERTSNKSTAIAENENPTTKETQSTTIVEPTKPVENPVNPTLETQESTSNTTTAIAENENPTTKETQSTTIVEPTKPVEN
ncbi:MAG: PD40 domain-containing protein, partial [Fluviicola sp.]|nr:PD40 domain-containing protein [Fluviicola sp.]